MARYKGADLSDCVAEALNNWRRLKEAERGSPFPERKGKMRRGRWKRAYERPDAKKERISITLEPDVLEKWLDAVWHQDPPEDLIGYSLDDALNLWVEYRLTVERRAGS